MSDGMRGKTMPVITQELMIHRVCTQQMLQGTLRVTKSIQKKSEESRGENHPTQYYDRVCVGLRESSSGIGADSCGNLGTSSSSSPVPSAPKSGSLNSGMSAGVPTGGVS